MISDTLTEAIAEIHDYLDAEDRGAAGAGAYGIHESGIHESGWLRLWIESVVASMDALRQYLDTPTR